MSVRARSIHGPRWATRRSLAEQVGSLQLVVSVRTMTDLGLSMVWHPSLNSARLPALGCRAQAPALLCKLAGTLAVKARIGGTPPLLTEGYPLGL